MAGEHSTATLDGNFRETYGPNVENAKPKGTRLRRDLQFIPQNRRPGNQFHFPVSLTHEHGFTYLPAGATTLTLNDAVAHNMKDATVVGTQCVLRSRISYEVAARASSGKPRAFERAMNIVVENMLDSFNKRCEIDHAYGQKGLGKVLTVNVSVTAGLGTITVRTTHWAPGIFAGQENAKLHVFSTTATGNVHVGGKDLTISKVDIANRVITTTETFTGTQVSADDFLYFEGQRTTDTSCTHNVYMGIDGILTATGSTEVHGIQVQSFSLWQGNTHSAGADLTFAIVNQAMAKAVAKGLDEDVILYINPDVWADLLDDEAGQRRHMSAGGRYEVGAEGITFYTQSGTIMIKSSIYVKVGDGFVISPKFWKLVGATDITFRLPDRGDEFFKHVSDAAAYELRAYANMAVCTRALAKGLKVFGITS